MNEEEIKKTLKEIYEKGFEIRDILKEKLNHPSTRSKEEILTDPEIFYYSLFESFWKLFKIISDNIENPLIQPWIRVIIEQFSDIISYSEKSYNEKKEIACKYFLCTLGFLGGEHSNPNYDSFLGLLDNPKEKNNFLGIKQEGYPIKKIHDAWYRLFPSVNDKLPDFIEDYFLTIKGNSIKKSQLEIFFRDMSLYHHPNIVLDNLEREFNDKSHIFRCFALMSMCGISLIRFAKDKNQYVRDENKIEELNRKITNLFTELYSEKRKNEN